MKTMISGFKAGFMMLLLGALMAGCGAGGGGGANNNPGSGGGDTTPPAVSAVSPANGATSVAINSSITVTFSESVDGSTVSTGTFIVKDGSNNIVSGSVTSGSPTATFTPSQNLTANTTYTVTITTGVKDSAGNAMTAAYTWTFTTGTTADTTPPTVSSTSPANNAADVALNSAITATFSEAMDVSTITTSTFTLKQGTTPVSGAVTYSGTTATFTPSGDLAYSTSYTATIATGAKDTAGNAMASDYTWTFTTTSGSLDTAFGTGGKATVATVEYAQITALGIQSDDKIVTGYGTPDSYGYTDFALARSNKDGTLDSTFGTGGKVTTNFVTATNPCCEVDSVEYVRALGIQSDGKIVAAGTSVIDRLAGNVWYHDKYFALARYNTDGTLDSTFGTGGKATTYMTTTSLYSGTNDFVTALGIQSDGKIVVTGQISIVRYNTDGTLDSTFGTSGKVTSYSLSNGSMMGQSSLGIQSDGKIVAAGGIMGSQGGDFAVARYNTDGTFDTTFGTGGAVITNFDWDSTDSASDLVIQSDGKIVAAGHSDTNSAVVRYNTDGTLDTTFGTGGKVVTDIGGYDGFYALGIQTDGKIVAAGTATNSSRVAIALARYNTDGTFDSSFGIGGKVITDFETSNAESIKALGIQSDGKIVAGGFFWDTNNHANDACALVRYLP